MISPRGPMATRRITAHWVVLTAAAVTTLVAAAVAATLAVFGGGTSHSWLTPDRESL